MKIVLRERTTGLWLKTCGRWEPTSTNARQFELRAEAVQCAIGLHFPDVEVCFIPDDDEKDSRNIAIRRIFAGQEFRVQTATDRWENEGGALDSLTIPTVSLG